ncbi:hypothetical protein [Methylobacterium frigidaeris]|uniref:Uncharacterized protein n=1 Tax=Methylobacterium frigidaeris TaxID=2038277 RepID=A0AA37M3D9_9HYPH|nr:hypothetical protein [Methylobacterium frigidaeris]PIK74365.1 hypothetical protein CS379_02940 [Methylobacterium frigidaeris]GJD61237.1 hypothetical protein MPEAHAMD_1377 [Methylobacterium frigidaeris]
MEMIVILAAVAALVFAGLVFVFAHGRARNPSLRLPHEQELEDRGDELFRDFDEDLAGLLEEAARQPAAQRAFPERLEAPEAPRFRQRGGMTIDHDPAEPGLPEPGARATGPSKFDPSKFDSSKRDGESR